MSSCCIIAAEMAWYEGMQHSPFHYFCSILFYSGLYRGQSLSEHVIIPPTAEEKILLLYARYRDKVLTDSLRLWDKYLQHFILHIFIPCSITTHRPNRTRTVDTMDQHKQVNTVSVQKEKSDHIRLSVKILCHSGHSYLRRAQYTATGLGFRYLKTFRLSSKGLLHF